MTIIAQPTTPKQKIVIAMITILIISFLAQFIISTVNAQTGDLLESYDESNHAGGFIWIMGVHPSVDSDKSAVGQCFITPSDTPYVLTSACFYLKRGSNIAGNMVACLYEMTGTYGTNGEPTGSPLATSETVACSTLTTDWDVIVFTFTDSYEMLTSHEYCITVQAYDGTWSGSYYVFVGVDNTPAHGGNCVSFYSNNWYAVSASDTIFYVYGSEAESTTAPQYEIETMLYSTNERHSTANFSVECYIIDGELGSYIPSYDYGSGYTNDSAELFSATNNSLASYQITLDYALGTNVSVKFYLSSLTGYWNETTPISLIVSATVTFTFTDGGILWINGSTVTNSSTTVYSETTYLNLACLGSQYYLYEGITSTYYESTENPYLLNVENATTIMARWSYYGVTDTSTLWFADRETFVLVVGLVVACVILIVVPVSKRIKT